VKRGRKKRPARPAVGHTAAPERGPDSREPDAGLRWGLAAFQRSEYAGAIGAWRRVRQVAPSAALDRALAEAHFRRGLAAGSPAQRVQDFQEAIALRPDSAVYHLHLGLALRSLGQLGRARAALEAAHRHAPQDQRIQRCLALLLLTDPAHTHQVHELFAQPPKGDEMAARLRALAALRSNRPEAAAAMLQGRPSLSPLGQLTLGLAHLAAGDPEVSAEVLTRLRRSRQPRPAEVDDVAALGLLRAYLQTGALGRALGLLRQLKSPHDPAARGSIAAAARELGTALALSDQLKSSVLSFEHGLVLEPNDALVRHGVAHLHEVLGTGAAREGDLAQAMAHWEAALAVHRDSSRLLHNLALAAERLGRWQQASAHWEETIRLWKKEVPAPSDASGGERRRRLAVAYRHLAAAQEAAGDIRAAARTLDHALNFDASDVDLRLRAAALHLDGEDYGSAISHLRQALSARPDDFAILLELGTACTLQGDSQQAVTYLQRARALDSGNPAVAAALAQAHYGLGLELEGARRFNQAVEEVQLAVALAPREPEYLQCLGRLCLALGRVADARSAFERAVALDPRNAVLQVAIGDCYLQYGRRKEAEHFFWQALRLDRSPSVQIMVGIAYLEHDDLNRAAGYFLGLLKLRDRTALLTIARALLAHHQDALAVPYLEQAVALDRSDPSAHRDLALAYAFGLRDYRRAASELSAAETVARGQDDQATLAAIAQARRMIELLGMETPVPRSLALEGARS